MKKIISFIFISLIIIPCLTGCLKKDMMENINIATTIYPIEYVTNKLYGKHSIIKSIYPHGAVALSYEISKKQLKDYSEYDLFIYNGESNERDYATSMLKNNRNLKIIDAAYGIEASYSNSDIWLNPSNMLMLGQNIKTELIAYISDPYLIQEIEKNYSLLKVDITELETEMKKANDNSVNNSIVVADESLNFLKKYGFEIINLTNNGKNKSSNIELAKSLIENNKINYLFVMENSPEYDVVKNLKETYNLEILTFRTIDTLSEKDVENNDDYLSIMHSNIDLLKKETYK